MDKYQKVEPVSLEDACLYGNNHPNIGIKTPYGIQKMLTQEIFTKINNLPFFAGDGGCVRCGKNAYDNPYYLIESARSTLLTGCTNCCQSWCE